MAHCWAHVRRKYFEAERNYPQCGEALDLLGELFASTRPDPRSWANVAASARTRTRRATCSDSGRGPGAAGCQVIVRESVSHAACWRASPSSGSSCPTTTAPGPPLLQPLRLASAAPGRRLQPARVRDPQRPRAAVPLRPRHSGLPAALRSPALSTSTATARAVAQDGARRACTLHHRGELPRLEGSSLRLRDVCVEDLAP
ncbi:MAG: transposase [Deltaproteobacteria bacterium]|nr:transposase [Deltaproteobacteria bacterium]